MEKVQVYQKVQIKNLTEVCSVVSNYFTNLSDQKTKLPKVVPRRPYTMYFEFFAEDFNKNFYFYEQTKTTNNKHGSNTCQYIDRLTRCQTMFTNKCIIHCISVLGLEVFVVDHLAKWGKNSNKFNSQQRRSLCRFRWSPETNRWDAGKFGSMVRSTFDLVDF